MRKKDIFKLTFLVYLQYRCTGVLEWITTQVIYSITRCDLPIYDGVRCIVRTVNGAGVSDVATSAEVVALCSSEYG